MTPSDPPTLTDDEATLQRYAMQLGDAFEKIARAWLERLIEQTARGLTHDVGPALDREAAATVADLRALLAKDIAHQPIGPLEVLRRAVRVPTAILLAAEVPIPQRDEFVVRNFPDDIYNLTPASFADVDPALLEPGLVWGAAKAHVHLRRRRESLA